MNNNTENTTLLLKNGIKKRKSFLRETCFQDSLAILPKDATDNDLVSRRIRERAAASFFFFFFRGNLVPVTTTKMFRDFSEFRVELLLLFLPR